ncbi:MAG TPA: CocE/NonD family hydrolase [Candidatus Magasanikbacteria bacterium]|nr:CocE/NonD family hydrolase [Candidatus Magasanikbacteria bacterium]
MNYHTMKPMRLRINTDIVTEFLPPRRGGSDHAIVVCDGLPSVPSKRHVLEYWSKRGFWVFHPRYKGTWESSGVFLDHDPTDDILEVVRTIKNGILIPTRKKATGLPGHLKITHVTIIGASFGGAAALLASLHPEVDKVIAISPVIDWREELYRPREPLSDLREYIHNVFGEAYRFSDSDFNQLGVDVQFFNPIARITEYNPKKICIMHAKDDMIVSYDAVERFLTSVACKRRLVKTGGHFSARVTTGFFVGRMLRRFIFET